MKKFRIISENGMDMGIYHGATPAEALDAMAVEAGYIGQTAAEEVTRTSFRGTVTEVKA